MDAIMKSRNQGMNGSPVCAPIYDAPSDVQYSRVTEFPIKNLKDRSVTEDIRSLLNNGPEYTDISGYEVTAVVQVGDKTFNNQVKIIGKTNTHYVVTFPGDDTEYSIRMSMCKFVNPMKIE